MWHWWIPDADGPLGNIAQAAKPGHCAHPTPPLLFSTLPCHVQTYIGFVRSTILTLVSGKCFCLSFVPSLRELGYTQFTWEMVLRVGRKEWCEGTEVYCQSDFWAKVGKLAVPQGIFGKHTDYPRKGRRLENLSASLIPWWWYGGGINPLVYRPSLQVGPVCKFLCLYEGSGAKQDKTKGRKLISFEMRNGCSLCLNLLKDSP